MAQWAVILWGCVLERPNSTRLVLFSPLLFASMAAALEDSACIPKFCDLSKFLAKNGTSPIAAKRLATKCWDFVAAHVAGFSPHSKPINTGLLPGFFDELPFFFISNRKINRCG
jgi:hypothetical protein